MSDVKQVKVDNWGIYFLQRLKHFFNRTDYCDLTLQFQDNAQLKVHRLVLNACTEYFELLERTCEMYEDCLVMPDDLQADVVVPIVNFMYTGHLEFQVDLLERLYQTSLILNMPVLSKLLESHRQALKTPKHSYSGVKKFKKSSDTSNVINPTISNKRSYSKAFDNNTVSKEKKIYHPYKNTESGISDTYGTSSPVTVNKKGSLSDPRPTRYELPEELDQDNLYDNSFCNISYTCKPLMVHPDTVKRYSSKKTGIFSGASSSKKLLPGTSTVDIVECKRITKENNIFDDNDPDNVNEDLDFFQTPYNSEPVKNSSQLFDQILDDGPKVTIEAKDNKTASNLDHAKIISEVLKKYPHLVKSNKNIKLKILSTPNKPKKQHQKTSNDIEETHAKHKTEEPDYTYETDVLDSQQAAKLIALGAENTKGPWICLICGTPGKALHFPSYYKFRRHLVDVHHEKPVSNICEYCGLKSLKRNYLLHHLYSQHGVPPPPSYNFPQCNRCSYIALTEGLLVKHKMTHKDIKYFHCNVCSASFTTTRLLLEHIQVTGHKYSAEKKTNLQCIYCLRTFLREGNLYAHLKTNHKKEAKSDGVIEDSDDEKITEAIAKPKLSTREGKYHPIKVEPSTSYNNASYNNERYNSEDYNNEYEVDVQYQIQQGHDGDIQLTPTKHHNVTTTQHKLISNMKQKILNPGFETPKPTQQEKPVRKQKPETSPLFEINIPSSPVSNNYDDEEIVLIDNTEYVMRDNQLIPRNSKTGTNDYIISDMVEPASLQEVQPTTSIEYTEIRNPKMIEEATSRMLVKKATNINQPIQIVVSNEEEYKALMASNHPILFDNDVDANKTLTVLTAQNDTTMQSATIDLNDTQTNDMMIIQDNYPINVPEAVTTDNSNIVVVYSHPVDDQNKQYQILTSGGIGSQFVDSSAIITQNFETVTTSTPVTSATELVQQVNTTWQNNTQDVSNQQMPIEAQLDIQNVDTNTEITSLQNETGNSLSHLQEVNVHESERSIPHDGQVIVATNQLNEINPEIVNQTVESEILEKHKSISDPQNETNVLKADEEQETVDVSISMEISQENESMSCLTNNAKQTENNQVPIETENTGHNMVSATEHNVNKEHTESTEISEYVPQAKVVDNEVAPENSEVIENSHVNALIGQQPLPESQAYDDIVKGNTDVKEDTPHNVKDADETIEKLTSEWSEDEYDTVNENVSKPEDVAPPVPEQLEETIENIRQEIQNQLNSSPADIATLETIPKTTTKDVDNSILENTLTNEEPQQCAVTEIAVATAVQNDPQTQEKISSLLNDWEDNDSQEDNHLDDPVLKKENLSDVTIEKIPKTDNIKTLVSDWDDEEENNTE